MPISIPTNKAARCDINIQESNHKTETAFALIPYLVQSLIGLGFITVIIILGAFNLMPDFLLIAAVAFAWLAFF